MQLSLNKARYSASVAVATVLAAAAGVVHANDAPDAPAADAGTDSLDVTEVIVTGTRQIGITAIDSPAPVQVLSSQALEAAAGNPDLMSTLAQIVPSLTMNAFGADTAGNTLQARLRGLSPNHVLVLVNGKRRHTTANLAVDLGSPYQGGAGADLNFIPVDAIDHIEVLTDGAAAQYGSDAIAGVITIILKKNNSGGKVDATTGRYFNGGGNTSDVGGNVGLEPETGGYFNLTAEDHNHGHSNVGDPDPRAFQDIGTYPNSNMTQLAGYPNVNLIFGDAETHLKLAALNMGLPIAGVGEFYTTATYGDKKAASYENYRPPQRISYTDPTTGVTTYPYPFGFNPQEATAETDFQIVGGLRGRTLDWNWDISSSYGSDKVDVYTNDSIGNSYPINGLPTPTDFYDGFLKATQWTTTADFNRDLDVGMAGPLNVAFGGEFRRDTYAIGAGIPDSYEDGGAQSYPGFSPTSAGSHSRKNEAAYIDFAAKPIDPLRIDAAARYEHYSDFGSTTSGKLTMRYDFTPQFAARATASNGFRAPTLAEAYYTSTNVGPSTAYVQLPPDSAAGKLLGIGNGLQPEKSIDFSAGLVWRPMDKMSATLDLYQIRITNRIVGSGNIYGQVNGVPTAIAGPVNAAINASGNAIDPAVLATGTTGLNVFSNGIDTRTRGADLSFNFSDDYAFGHIDYLISGTYTQTVLTNTPPELPALPGVALYDQTAISELTTANPRYVINLGVNWKVGNLTVDLLEKLYGPSWDYENDDGDNASNTPQYFRDQINFTPITNLDVGYNFTKQLKIDIGALNLFNRYPPNLNSNIISREFAADDYTMVEHYPGFSPFGIDGGFYYAKATFSF
jgi:iron complex outermembrane recepter protein